MRYRIDHDYHIHSMLSRCSRDPEQSKDFILQYAKENGLSRICLTDHYWDAALPRPCDWYAEQHYDHIAKSLPLPQDESVSFLFGCEGDIDAQGRIGVPPSRFDNFDFIVIPTTHLHKIGLISEADAADGPSRHADVWLARFDALLDADLPFHRVGVAHLACTLMYPRSHEGYLDTLRTLSDGEMERVFSKAAARGCGIELNMCDMSFPDAEADTVLRMFRIAKSCGCKFYLGSDSHHPREFVGMREVFERAITMLDLHETDKFYIEK